MNVLVTKMDLVAEFLRGPSVRQARSHLIERAMRILPPRQPRIRILSLAIVMIGALILSTNLACARPNCDDVTSIQTSEDLSFCARQLSNQDSKIDDALNDCKVYGDDEHCAPVIDSKAANVQQRVKALLARGGHRALLGNNTDGALSDFNQAIHLSPDNVDAYIARAGLFATWAANPRRAIDDYSKAIAMEPLSSEAYEGRGQVHVNLAELDRALADFSESIAILRKRRPSGDSTESQTAMALARAYNSRGKVFEKKGDLDRAISDFTDQINAGGSYLDRALAFAAKRDYRRAIDDVSEPIQHPVPAILLQGYYLLRGYLQLLAGHPTEGVLDFEQARGTDSEYLLWGELARRYGKMPSRLREQAREVDLKEWPGPLVQVLLQQKAIPAGFLAAANDPANDSGSTGTIAEIVSKTSRKCDAHLFAGLFLVVDGRRREAEQYLKAVAEGCWSGDPKSIIARLQLKALNP